MAFLAITSGRLGSVGRGIVIVVVIVATIVVDLQWKMEFAPSAPAAVRRAEWTAAALIGLGALVFVSAILAGTRQQHAIAPSTLAFTGLFLLFFGFGVLVDLWRIRVHRVLGLIAFLAPLILIIVGLIPMDRTGVNRLYLVPVGLVVLPIGIALVSEWGLQSEWFQRLRRGTRNWWIAGVIGVGILLLTLVIGTLEMTDNTPVTRLRSFVTILAVLALMWLVSARSNLDTVLVVVVLAVGWASSAHTTPLDAIPVLAPPDNSNVFVAIGDSYMSGEGAPQFISGTNKRDLNECRRADTTYAVSLAEEGRKEPALGIPGSVVFLACSGAVVNDLDRYPQYLDEPNGSPARLQHDGTYTTGATQIDQLNADLDQHHLHPTFALVSIGGNDALFSKIAEACIGPGDCSLIGKRWLDIFQRSSTKGNLPELLDRAYGAVESALPGIPIMVVPYPIPISDQKDCSFSELTQNERLFLNGFTADLDAVISNIALQHHFLVAPTRDSFSRPWPRGAADATAHGLQLCSTNKPDELGVNWLTANPTEGDMAQLVNPVTWIHNTFHPNVRGHEALTSDLRAAIESQIVSAKPSATANGGPANEPVRSIEQIMCGTETGATTCVTKDGGTWTDRTTVYCPSDATKSCVGSFLASEFRTLVWNSAGVTVALVLLADWVAILLLIACFRSVRRNTSPKARHTHVEGASSVSDASSDSR